jgi:small-conductance mechanosensitive channel
MTDLTSGTAELWQWPILRITIILAASLLVVLLVRLLVFPLILHLTRKTQTTLDDQLILGLRLPVAYTILLVGVSWSLLSLQLQPKVSFILLGLLKSMAALIWTGAALRIGSLFLESTSRRQGQASWIQPRTLPILRIAWKVLVVGGLFYFLLASWHIDVTTWVASAGVLGLAIGFAAKDTLANLFAGLFIIADAPYRIGDFVILEGGVRGVVTDIGVRSSRILTRDDIEVTVPNAVIANGEIINESGGQHRKTRVRVKVSAAYGSDLDQVRQVLLSCVEGVQNVCAQPHPRVRFREFGDSGLQFELLAWIEDPVYRGRVLDELNTRVYKAFHATGIEIPYAKHDVYIKQMTPASESPQAGKV